MLLMTTMLVPAMGLTIKKTTSSSEAVVKPILLSNIPEPKAAEKKPCSLQVIHNSVSPLADIPVAATESPEYRPAVAQEPGGYHLGAYILQTDTAEADTYFTVSLDDGTSWADTVYVSVEGMEDYPAVAYWGKEKTFLGTFQPDANDFDGSAQYLLRADDLAAPDTWTLVYWDWSTYNQRDKESPDIAGYSDVGDATWWYGVMVDTGSSDYAGAEGYHIPLFYFPSYTDSNSGWIWWWNIFNNTAHAAVDIDNSNGLVYGVWDYDNESQPEQQRDILLGVADVHDWWEEKWVLNWSTIGDVNVNETYPDVGAFGDKVCIVAQSDEAETQDIICYYSSNGGNSWEKSIVANDPAVDELYPRIVSYGDYLIVTYVVDGNLYKRISEDGGVTWGQPDQVNDVSGSVVTAYRTSDAAQGGAAVWTDNRSGNEDVYYDNVGSPPVPILEITSITCGVRISATIKNNGTAPAHNVTYALRVTGGIFGRINVNVSGTRTEPLNVGESFTISSDIFIGLGTISISVTATCDEGSSVSLGRDAIRLIIWTLLR
jgi:hypothetical protein